jgi:hypothetical protein
MGPMRRITFCLSCLCRFITHLLNPGWGPDPPPPCGARVPTVDDLYVDGQHSRISSFGTSQGGRHRCFLHSWWVLLDLRQHLLGGHHRCFLALIVGAPRSPTPAPPRGGRHRCFLALMVGALGSPAPAPHRGPSLTFFKLMVGTPGSPALAPPKGPPSTFLSVDGERSRISSSGTS